MVFLEKVSKIEKSKRCLFVSFFSSENYYIYFFNFLMFFFFFGGGGPPIFLDFSKLVQFPPMFLNFLRHFDKKKLYRGVRFKTPLNSETRFLGKRGTIFWKYFQMFEIFWAGYYFLRSPPKMAKIFWRFAPKHIDFAFKYGPKMPKIFRRFAPRIFSPRGPIFCKIFQFFRAGYYFFAKFSKCC